MRILHFASDYVNPRQRIWVRPIILHLFQRGTTSGIGCFNNRNCLSTSNIYWIYTNNNSIRSLSALLSICILINVHSMLNTNHNAALENNSELKVSHLILFIAFYLYSAHRFLGGIVMASLLRGTSPNAKPVTPWNYSLSAVIWRPSCEEILHVRKKLVDLLRSTLLWRH